jgi:hypothetical protein
MEEKINRERVKKRERKMERNKNKNNMCPSCDIELE